jgi:hypothetical protein
MPSHLLPLAYLHFSDLGDSSSLSRSDLWPGTMDMSILVPFNSRVLGGS